MYREVKNLALSVFMLSAMQINAIDVKELKMSKPFLLTTPLRTDSVDVNGKAFDEDAIQKDIALPLNCWKESPASADSILPPVEKRAIQLAGFQVETPMFAKCEVKTRGSLKPVIYIDGNKSDHADLTPGRHDVVLKFLRSEGKSDTLNVWLESKQENYLTVNPEGKRIFSLEDQLHGRRLGATSLSASGRFVKYYTSTTLKGGQSERRDYIMDLQTGNQIATADFSQWSEQGDTYLRRTRLGNGSIRYERVNPLNGQSETFFTDATASSGRFFAQERFMLIDKITEGPKKDSQVFQILDPDDRIAGWRNRNNVQVLSTETGQIVPLTIGQHNVSAIPSDDGQKIVLMVREHDITERPFSFATMLLVDYPTMKVDTLVRRDGFIGSVSWMPDGKSLIISGTPEAFGGIGKNDPTDKIPSLEQNELFRFDLETRKVESITFDFNPNILSWQYCRADGKIYALCENRDMKEIFSYDFRKGQWKKLELSECYVNSFSLSREKPLMTYTGQSQSNSDRIYQVDLKSGREKLLVDVNEERMGDIQLGEFGEWNFQSSRGDTICGRYYLPPHFDASRRYPMLVYYYGGCSPVGRYLDSYYNFHGWAGMGYVVYVIQPSGATGFGQEFAARHVNAYGDYTADDIIEGTKRFCQEHPFVNPQKIGCLGASYGGFMTMYLLTKTDIFAAAMAHAGISNPASYWGFGYWGYSYNGVCAAGSYPWNNTELYSGHAPLFNADKVHTPILFLHGSADTNVPIAESTQMFNALKILGRECAFVTVEGQNHHILDYQKRIKWVHTYYAWFAKYLQDDPTWWDTLYPKTNL